MTARPGAGHLYVEAPKCRKFRAAIYPVRTPDGYPLAGKLAARIEQARAEQQAGRPGPYTGRDALAGLPVPFMAVTLRSRRWRSYGGAGSHDSGTSQGMAVGPGLIGS